MTPKLEITYKVANTKKEFDDGQKLFEQYAHLTNLNLSFQDLANEHKMIDKQYNKPRGALLLAYKDEIAIGCAGIRELDINTAEGKRMFVCPEYRGYNIGRKLLELCIDIAKGLNYKKIRLDTLPNMTQAQKLYHEFGFYKIPSYRFNPIEGTIYMEKNLI